MSCEKKQTIDEFLLECIRQNPEDLRDKKMEKELLERIFQKIVDKHFYDDDGGQVLREALSTYEDKYFSDEVLEKQNLIEENYYRNIIKGARRYDYKKETRNKHQRTQTKIQ